MDSGVRMNLGWMGMSRRENGNVTNAEGNELWWVKCFTQSETNRLSELRMVSAAG